jgi:hypothetical protein
MPFLTRDACHWPTNFLSFFSYLERVLGRLVITYSSGASDNGNIYYINKPAVFAFRITQEVESRKKLDGRLQCASTPGSYPEVSVFRKRGWLDLAPDALGSSATNKPISKDTDKPLSRLRTVVPLPSRAWRVDNPSLPG